ncbi:DegT/DnrJ/EryC1/StrS family aminotransferase [Shewanella sp. 0m-8]
MFKYPLFKVAHSEAIKNNMLEVLDSGAIAGGGFVESFESELSRLTESPYIVSTSDVTSAVEITLNLANVEPGDEVIASPFSCLASNSPIAKLGLLSKWVDFLPNSIDIDVEHFVSLITDKTKVAIIYHLAGYPCDLQDISKICKERNIFLIEDCNNALLAEVNNSQVGKYGDVAVFSFYPNRQLHCLEGGALGLKSEQLANEAKKIRKFGINHTNFRNSFGEINSNSDIEVIGLSATLSNFNASVGIAQIENVNNNLKIARQHAATYREIFRNDSEITILEAASNSLPAFWCFLVKVANRDLVIEKMKAAKIHVSSLHQRNDIYSCFNNAIQRPCVEVATIQNELLALPCGWWLSSEDIIDIALYLKLITVNISELENSVTR